MFDTFLEYQYSPSQWVTESLEDGQKLVQSFFENAVKEREKIIKDITCDLELEYACGKKTKLDIYYPGDSKTAKHDVLIFVHGGYWQAGSKESHIFLASQIKPLDCIVVLPGYDLAPYESMDGIVKQIKLAILFIAEKFPDSRLFLCGHSAGAHLSAMMLNTSWDDSNIIMNNRVKGICAISGVYDLVPLISTSVNVLLKMDKETAMRNSPAKLTASEGLKLHCKVLVVVGEHESSEFHRQSKEYYQLLKERLTSVTFLEIPGVSHFDMMENCLKKDDFMLIKAIYNFMKDKE